MASRGSERVCVILGAGASHDVRGIGSPVKEAGLKPPLAKDLFDTQNLRRRAVLRLYPGAATLAQNLVHDIDSETNLEVALRHYAHHPTSEALKQRFKEVPPYLRDLLWLCSEEYTDWPSGYVRLATVLLEEHSYEVLFLVLNYDNLLEKALTLLEPDRYTFEHMEDYVNPDRAAQVVKIHGSINWFFPLLGRTSWAESIQSLNVLERPSEIDIRVIEGFKFVRQFRPNPNPWNWDHEPYMYPVLTAPLAGKDLDNIVCPGTHREFAESFLSTCQKYLVIGSSGSDDDLMKLLDGAIPADERMKIVHVVGIEGADDTRDNFKKGVRAFRGNATFSEFYEGFQAYLDDPAFKIFAD